MQYLCTIFAPMKKELTQIQKAFLLLFWFEGCSNFIDYYLACVDQSGYQNTPDAIEKRAYNFKHSQPVRDFLQHLPEMIKDRILNSGQSLKAGKGINSGESGQELQTDFRDPSQFIEYLNTRANELTDERDKREYLKLIADLMRFKESETGKDSEIMRFYTPVNCTKCPLYTEKSGK